MPKFLQYLLPRSISGIPKYWRFGESSNTKKLVPNIQIRSPVNIELIFAGYGYQNTETNNKTLIYYTRRCKACNYASYQLYWVEYYNCVSACQLYWCSTSSWYNTLCSFSLYFPKIFVDSGRLKYSTFRVHQDFGFSVSITETSGCIELLNVQFNTIQIGNLGFVLLHLAIMRKKVVENSESKHCQARWKWGTEQAWRCSASECITIFQTTIQNGRVRCRDLEI